MTTYKSVWSCRYLEAVGLTESLAMLRSLLRVLLPDSHPDSLLQNQAKVLQETATYTSVCLHHQCVTCVHVQMVGTFLFCTVKVILRYASNVACVVKRTLPVSSFHKGCFHVTGKSCRHQLQLQERGNSSGCRLSRYLLSACLQTGEFNLTFSYDPKFVGKGRQLAESASSSANFSIGTCWYLCLFCVNCLIKDAA